MAKNGYVIWLTGLSGSGKTTLAKALQEKLHGSIVLDGDELREALGCGNTGFDARSRKELAFAYSRLARLLANQGFIAIVSTISLFHEVHSWNRANLPGYIEIFLDIPESVRKARDPKGLYAAAKQGAINNMAGKDVRVEFPLNPDIILDEKYSIEKAISAIMDIFESRSGNYAQ